MLQIGSIVDGKYKILSKIGQGGMSVVYMALNERANKTWAIKEVRRDGVQDYEVVKQNLIVETDMLKRLNHPYLPSIIDVIEEKDSFLIVMDYIEGKPLSSTLREYGAQSQEDVIRWAKQLCDVLGYLHSRGIIYRDMKPSNVMLKPDGNIMLIDFGTARTFKRNQVADTTCLGTRGYAAPEQYGGHGQTTPRTDIYCLGATMYHLLTGHNPSEPPYEMYPITYWNPDLSTGLENIVLKCTQQNPEDRFQSCAELMYALDNYWETDQKYRRQQNRKLAAFAVTGVLTIACGAGAFGFWQAAEKETRNNYTDIMEEAQEEEDLEKKKDLYLGALAFEQENEEPYLDFLNSALSDSYFIEDEQEWFREMVNDRPDDGKKNEEVLAAKNEAGYHKICLKAGMAYFYFACSTVGDEGIGAVGNKGAIDKVTHYLEQILESENLTPNQVQRANLIYRIANYYEGIGQKSLTGDENATYRDYWSDLTAMTGADFTSLDSVELDDVLAAYRYLVNEIETKCGEFKNDGISREDMEEQLNNIESHLNGDVADALSEASGNNQSEYEEMIENITANLEEARGAILTVYGESAGDESSETGVQETEAETGEGGAA